MIVQYTDGLTAGVTGGTRGLVEECQIMLRYGDLAMPIMYDVYSFVQHDL